MKPTFRQLWGWPLVLGLLSASGLLSALVSEGWGDVWSWLALGGPTLLMAWLALVPGALRSRQPVARQSHAPLEQARRDGPPVMIRLPYNVNNNDSHQE